MHYDEQRESDLTDVDMSHYTNRMWFDEMRDYLTLIFTPEDPKPPKKPLTPKGLEKQTARVEEMVKAEFDKRFPELLPRTLFDMIEER